MKSPQSSAYDEAFSALFLAAERAIGTGKAHEMLHDLTVDRAGDFQKLLHGHQEWKLLAAALKNKDTSLLRRDRENLTGL
jgi:hypothetical protein